MVKRLLQILFVPSAVVAILLNIACAVDGVVAGLFPIPILHLLIITAAGLFLRWWPLASSLPIVLIGWAMPMRFYPESVIFAYYWLFFGLLLVVFLGSILAMLYSLFKARSQISNPTAQVVVTVMAPVVGFSILGFFIYLVIRRGI
jgi:hypothetical protein